MTDRYHESTARSLFHLQRWISIITSIQVKNVSDFGRSMNRTFSESFSVFQNFSRVGTQVTHLNDNRYKYLRNPETLRVRSNRFRADKISRGGFIENFHGHNNNGNGVTSTPGWHVLSPRIRACIEITESVSKRRNDTTRLRVRRRERINLVERCARGCRRYRL